MSTRKELLKLTKPQLIDRCEELNQSTSGKKEQLIKRILSAAAQIEESEEEADEREERNTMPDQVPIVQTFQELVISLKLHESTVKLLSDNGFDSKDDLQLLKNAPDYPRNLDFIVRLRDRLAIMGFVTSLSSASQASVAKEPSSSQPSSSSKQQPKEDLRLKIDRNRRGNRDREEGEMSAAKKKKRSMASDSATDSEEPGESTDNDSPDSHNSRRRAFPSRSRDIPRPHTFVYPSGGLKDNQKLSAKDISMNEFIAGSIRNVLKLAKSTEGPKRELLIEYVEYLDLLCNRRVCYTDKSVLEFDDEFRSYISNQRSSLNDYAERATIADRHFSANSRRDCQPTKPFLRGGSAGARQVSNPSSGTTDAVYKHFCCHKFQRNECLRPKCRYPHICGDCGQKHPACGSSSSNSTK